MPESDRSPAPSDAAGGLELLLGAEVYAPEPLGVRCVLVGGGRVLWIGEDPPQAARELGAAERDLAGTRLVPGFVDAHAHLTGGGGEAGYASRVPAPALSRYTTAGVTSTVGLLGTDDTVRTTGELLAHAHALRDEGLSAWIWTGGYHVPPTTLTGSVRGDLVHLEACIGVGELALSDHRSSQPTLDELLRVAADAHVAGLMTGKAGVVHLHMGDGERGLELVRLALETSELPPRVFHPTHVNRRRRLFEESLELAAHGCTIDVTAFPSVSGDDELKATDAVRRYLASDLPAERLTVSSDGGGCLPRFDAEGAVTGYGVGSAATLPRLVRELVEAGEPLERALLPVTTNPARHLRLARKGRIAVGGDADLVALDAAGDVRDVMARGRWHVLDGRAVVAGSFETESQ